MALDCDANASAQMTGVRLGKHMDAEGDLSIFRAVVDTSSDAVAILSCEGETIYVNPSHQKLFGRAPDGKEWRGYLDLHTEEGRHVVRHFVLPSLEQGREWDGVLDAKDAEGQVFPLWQRALVWRDQTGQPRYYFVFMRDHRGQQRLREELRKAKELTEQANVAKSRFLAAASHDLRQPLQALSMFVAVLSNRSHAPEDRQLIKRIDDSVCAVETLLNGLLDVSKLEAGLVIPALASFDMAPLLTRLATEFQPMAAEAGLSFRWVPSHSLVRSDPVLLERILRNLLNNALRYTKTGAILLGCRHRKGRLFIEVWDTGIGIPRNHLKLIFREFHQLGNSARDRRQGLGLGLAIVDRLARLLGHEVNVVSELQKGSMFSIELPVAKVTATTVQPKQLPLGIRNGCSTILIIEDEPDVLESIHLLLESWGFYALSSRSCDEALLALSKEGRLPDLILADYRLQGGATGAHAINRIRSCLKSLLPAIILTGDTAPERLRQAKASGYNVLHKPVQPVVLRRMIDEVLARSPSVRSSGA